MTDIEGRQAKRYYTVVMCRGRLNAQSHFVLLPMFFGAMSLVFLPVGGAPRAEVETAPVDVPLAVEAVFTFSFDELFENVVTAPIRVTFRNRSTSVIMILWDDCALVDSFNVSHRIIHKGVPLADRMAPQAPTPIAPGGWLFEEIWPADKISWVLDQWKLWPMSVREGSVIQLHLAWRTHDGPMQSAAWSWRVGGCLPAVRVTLYVRESGQRDRPVAGARVLGKDGSGFTFEVLTGDDGSVQIPDGPYRRSGGNWDFTVMHERHKTVSWSQSITESVTLVVELEKLPSIVRAGLVAFLWFLFPARSDPTRNVDVVPWVSLGALHLDERGNVSIKGVNVPWLGLWRQYYKGPLEAGLKPYWGWGTIILFAPYVEAGISLFDSNGPVASLGFFIMPMFPYVNFWVRF